MSKELTTIFETDISGKITTCILTDGTNTFHGIASCHDDDMEFRSSLVGQEIAYNRAVIEYLRHCRDTEIKPKLQILNHLICSMKNSKHFNPKSYETKMIFRQINLYNDILLGLKEEIAVIQRNTQSLIQSKNETYTKFRNVRKKKAFEERLKEIEKTLEQQKGQN